MSAWRGARVLVTGAAGFLGAHLVRRLAREGATVYAVDRTIREGAQDVAWHRADLEDRGALTSLLARLKPETVLHVAGRVDLARTPEITDACIRENVHATANLLWALEGSPLKAFVLTSTTEVYGRNRAPFHEEQPIDPPSPYAISKVAAEQLCRFFHEARGYPTAVLRLSTVYGPGQAEARLIPSVIRAVLAGQPLAMTSGEQRRDFVYVDDAIDGVLRAALEPAARGHVINLGHDRPVSLRELVETIRTLMRADWAPSYGALSSRSGEAASWSCDGRKAKAVLGWEPRTRLEEGLASTIAAYRTALAQDEARETLTAAER